MVNINLTIYERTYSAFSGFICRSYSDDGGDQLSCCPSNRSGDGSGSGAFEDPDSVFNAFLFIFAMLVVTAVLLILIKSKAQQVISLIIGFSLAAVIYYVVMALLRQLGLGIWADIGGVIVGIGIIALLWLYPEWYVINIAGIVVAAGCAAIFGVSLSLLPVLILLVLLMVYDFIAVKRSKHMLTLADGVLRQKMPIMFLVPKKKGYSYRKNGLYVIRKENAARCCPEEPYRKGRTDL